MRPFFLPLRHLRVFLLYWTSCCIISIINDSLFFLYRLVNKKVKFRNQTSKNSLIVINVVVVGTDLTSPLLCYTMSDCSWQSSALYLCISNFQYLQISGQQF